VRPELIRRPDGRLHHINYYFLLIIIRIIIVIKKFKMFTSGPISCRRHKLLLISCLSFNVLKQSDGIARQVYSIAEMYEPAKRYVIHNVTSMVEFLWYFPSRLGSSRVIINSTRQHSLFHNVSLHGLDIPLQAFRIHLDCLQCSSNVTGL